MPPPSAATKKILGLARGAGGAAGAGAASGRIQLVKASTSFGGAGGAASPGEAAARIVRTVWLSMVGLKATATTRTNAVTGSWRRLPAYTASEPSGTQSDAVSSTRATGPNRGAIRTGRIQNAASSKIAQASQPAR